MAKAKAKVFRIHEGGKQSSGWFESQLTSDFIETISTEDNKGTKITTAVPTPFGRMDLVQKAFRKIATSNQLIGDTDEHKLISDALDLGQILFNYDTHKNELDIIRWNYSESETSAELFNASDPKHKSLGRTLRLFLNQDAEQYNFNKADCIYIVLYNNKIIGATSPSSLFFASVRVKEIDTGINFGGPENVFGNSSYPLCDRDSGYIKYLFALSKRSNFKRHFSELHEYLDRTLTILEDNNSVLASELNNIDESYLTDFPELSLPDQDNVIVEPISGFALLQSGGANDVDNSHFKMAQSEHNLIKNTNLPLVMPQGVFDRNWIYVNAPWNDKITVPKSDDRPISERTLPTIGIRYPNVIAADFFAKKIIRLPYQMDDNCFYTMSSDKDLGHYLIPITSLFFDYYPVEELAKRLLIESKSGDSVKVSLTISTVNGDIKYSQIYSPSSDLNTNYTIEEIDFTLGVFPFIQQIENDNSIDYTIAAGFSQFEQNKALEIKVLSSDNQSSTEIQGTERSNITGTIFTKIFAFKENFDAIEIKARGICNLLIPKLKVTAGNRAMSFGIDFGTTNTHLAYKIGTEDQDFVVRQNEPLIAFLKAPSYKEEKEYSILLINEVIEAMVQETLPRNLNDKSEYPFPFQTCLFENRASVSNDTSRLFADANIGFDYGLKKIKTHLEPIPDLKWATVGAGEKGIVNRNRVRLYIQELLLLCKWTVIQKGGDLMNTKIYWTYPTSMRVSRINHFSRIWKNEFEKAFPNSNSQSNLIRVPESTAPFYYAARRVGMNVNNDPTITIDVGGGTTDVAIFDKGKPKLITSFKFGGNAIFGDGFNRNKDQNGFVKEFVPLILRAVEVQNSEKIKDEVIAIIEELGSESSHILNYLFSLEQHDKVKGANITEELMSFEPLKIVFLLFYGAIIYHIAQIFKVNDLKLPRNILFSGTASKSLTIIDASDNYTFINTYFKEIFRSVLGADKVTENSNMEVFSGIKEHKELTAKGMLYDTQPLLPNEIESLKKVHSGEQNPLERTLSLDDLKDNDTIFSSVENNFKAFFELFIDLKTKLNFTSTTGMTEDSLKKLKSIYYKDVRSHIQSGILNEYEANNSGDESISETLFFYPFKGLLPELAYQIVNENKSI